jgi:transcriptional regulator with XRE-family HTH domain
MKKILKKMKQPELGKKLADFRNEIGLTQEQLSEKTKINIRTIQRIETGEVTPRVYTLKAILETLGRNLDDVNGDFEEFVIERPGIFKTSWIAAIALVFSNALFIAIVVLRDLYGIRSAIYHFNVPVLLSIIILTILLNRGIIYAGKTFNNKFFVITGYIGVLLCALVCLFQIVKFYSGLPHIEQVAKASIIFSAINGIFYGVGLILFKQQIYELAYVTGILMIFQSVLCIIPIGLVELIGIILSIPTLLLQAMIFYRLQTSKFNPKAYS